MTGLLRHRSKKITGTKRLGFLLKQNKTKGLKGASRQTQTENFTMLEGTFLIPGSTIETHSR